jgi:hypothetical protein
VLLVAIGSRALKTLSASERAQALPSKRIASMILAELEDDRRCDREFARSLDTLAKLAAPAMAEYHAGKTHELDPETL